MLPLKNITPSLQIQFFVSCNKEKSLKFNKHLGNIIIFVLKSKIKNNNKYIPDKYINQWYFHIVQIRSLTLSITQNCPFLTFGVF